MIIEMQDYSSLLFLILKNLNLLLLLIDSGISSIALLDRFKSSKSFSLSISLGNSTNLVYTNCNFLIFGRLLTFQSTFSIGLLSKLNKLY